MKIVAIGDIHGRSEWKKIVEKEKDADKIIFIGDYFDTHQSISANKQIQNFKDILKFRNDNYNQVVLLLGNHDYHYLPGVPEHYSGYNYKYANEIQEVLKENLNKLGVVYQYEDILFSHAGITQTWFNSLVLIPQQSIDTSINVKFNFLPEILRFSPGINNDGTGDDITQSCIWVRPKSLMEDALPNFKQVVGHTMRQMEIDIYSEGDRKLAFIDALHLDQYLIIENGEWRDERIS